MEEAAAIALETIINWLCDHRDTSIDTIEFVMANPEDLRVFQAVFQMVS